MHYLDFDNIDDRVLGTILRKHAQAIPDRPCLIADTRRISFAEAYDTAARYALGMQALGIGRNDRVCLFMTGSPEFVLLALATNLLGAQWIPVNTDYRGEWLATTLADSQPALLISDAILAERLAELEDIHCRQIAVAGDFAGRLVPNQYALSELLAADAESFEPADVHYGDTASVMWTSGTTGRSKGVMQSHNAWVRSALSTVAMGGIGEGASDVIYNCLPLYNSAAWVANIYPALLAGVPCAMDPAFSASSFWERTRFYGATHTFTLGAMHMFLWNAPERPDDADNPVRSAQMVPMPEELMAPFCRRFGLQSLHQGFGQSEIMLLLRRLNDGSRNWKPNALGEPPDDIDVALLDDDGNPVPAGEVGEVCVRPKAPFVIFNGYFNDPDATRNAFRGDWYCTGDLARSDTDGNYFFVDRKKDLIRYKGRSVSSVAIESIARRHPAVEACAAFGIESAELASEHEIKLDVVLKPGAELDAETLARFINNNAPYFFVPRYIEFVEVLPMTPTQKARKNLMRERGVTANTWDARAADFVVEK